MPLIGIAQCAHTADYEAAIQRAGAEFQLLDPLHDDVVEAVRTLDGLLLTGGGDVDPALFGETPHQTYRAAEPGRDEHEIALVRAAMAAELPVLAICRGLQVMNVAYGGTLVQDIPSAIASAVTHQIDMPKNAQAHEVWINRESRLAALLQERLEEGDTCMVNSRHHQAVARVAEGFVVVGSAPDGVIEAVEHQTAPFCLGVQWHPENFWRTGEFRSLFEGFVAAAAERRR
jgi:putative glutamine amidotransferase